MKILLTALLSLTLLGCADTAVIKEMTDSNVCGPGVTRLVPTEGTIWLVLCEDGRVLWLDDENI